MPCYFEIRRYGLTEDFWLPVKVPMECSRVVIENSGSAAMLVRSDAGNSDTEKRVASYTELDITSPVACFEQHTVLCFVRSATGPGSVVVTFTR